MSTKTTAPEWAITRRVRVSKKYSAKITMGPNGSTVDSIPYMPPRGGLTQGQIARYQRGSNALAQEVATKLGGTLLMMDLGADGRLTPSHKTEGKL